MILLSHPTADGNARHVARALSRAGMLGEFWTYSEHDDAPLPLAIKPISLPESPPIASSSVNARVDRDAACRSLDRLVSTRLANEQFQGVYAYVDSADESFRVAGRLGLLRIYDLSTGHWQAERDICAEEAALEPEWADTLLATQAIPSATERKDAELNQADLVIVPSTFTLHTLENLAALTATIAILPRGAPVPREPNPPIVPNRSSPGEKLRVLFVGDLGQRKGLSYLFRACRELRGAVSLTVIGPPPAISCSALERELSEVRWRPACSAGEILAEMASHDVLVAPSLFEGFDPVILDALASGLPVIATPHTAAPDLIDHGMEGFIVPVRSTEEIVAKLELLLREPERRAEMSLLARQRAQRHTWENYERALAASVATALSRR